IAAEFSKQVLTEKTIRRRNRSMRVLITGGAGFLGRHLCELLSKAGHSVVCRDNFSTGRPENVAPLLGHAQSTFINYDVCDSLHVEATLDAVMHFAPPASPQ